MRPALFAITMAWLAASACAAPALVEVDPTEASARSKPSANAMVPKELEYFVGTWLVSARDPSTDKVLSITYKVEPSIGGKWLAGSGESSDQSVRARDSWGIDPANGDVVRFVFDSSGAYGIIRSRGWLGDRLILEGEAQSQGGPTKVRETITRMGPDRFDAIWEAQKDGFWQAYSIEQVTRQR